MNPLSIRKFGSLFFLFVLFIASCNKNVNLDRWEPNMLVPLVKGTATVREVTDLAQKKFTQEIPGIDIGYAPFVPVNVPPLKINFVGPYEHTLSEFFRFVKVDSAVFDIELTNAFPIPISKGTRVVFRSSPDTTTSANIFYSHTLTQDVPAYGTYPKFEDIVVDKTITSVFYLYLENFETAGANNVTFDTRPTELGFEIKFLSVLTVAVNTDKEYTVTGTSEMKLGDEVANYNDSTAQGMLKFFMSNSMPIAFNFQMYFYDQTQTVLLDSLYYGIIHTDANHTNQVGVPQDSVQTKFEIPLSADRVRRLKEAKFMEYRLTGNTYGNPPGGVIYVGSECRLRIQLTGDIKLKVATFLPL